MSLWKKKEEEEKRKKEKKKSTAFKFTTPLAVKHSLFCHDQVLNFSEHLTLPKARIK